MAESQHYDFLESFSRSDAINMLAEMAEEHSRCYDRVVVRVHDPIHPIDHVIATVLKRSVALTQAFLHLWDQGNEFAAMPLIRLQLDSVLRISAFRFVDDSMPLTLHMAGGEEPFHKFKIKDENDERIALRDNDLRAKLKHKYEYLDSIYEQTSGYVHLSREHLLRVVEGWDKPDRNDDAHLDFGGVDDLHKWSEVHKREALLLFCTATRYLLDEIEIVQNSDKLS
jgi:hypothetical protein